MTLHRANIRYSSGRNKSNLTRLTNTFETINADLCRFVHSQFSIDDSIENKKLHNVCLNS